MKCLLLRDADCGALAVIPTSEGVVTMDHGFSDFDYSVVLEVLESNGRVTSQGNGILAWGDLPAPERVFRMIESALRGKGYSDNKHDSQVILRVDEEEAKHPSCPFPRQNEYFHESLENALRKDVAKVHAAAASLGEFLELTTRFQSQRRTGRLGESLPFVRISGIIKNPVDTVEEVRKALMDTLPEACLTKAVVENIDEGYLVDFGYAPTAEMCNRYVLSSTPQFDPSKVRGARSVRFRLQAPLSEVDARRFEGVAMLCGAAQSINFPNRYTVVARAGSDYIGESIRDDEFGERLNWMFDWLVEWSPSIDVIGVHEPLVMG